MLAEHSPIRIMQFEIRIEFLPAYVSGHLVRHFNGVEKFAQSMREDITGIPNTEIRRDTETSLILLLISSIKAK